MKLAINTKIKNMIVQNLEEKAYRMIFYKNRTECIPVMMREILFKKYIIRIIASRILCNCFHRWAITKKYIPKTSFSGRMQDRGGNVYVFLVSYISDDFDVAQGQYIISSLFIERKGNTPLKNLLYLHKSKSKFELWFSRFNVLDIMSSPTQQYGCFKVIDFLVIFAYAAFVCMLLHIIAFTSL